MRLATIFRTSAATAVLTLSSAAFADTHENESDASSRSPTSQQDQDTSASEQSEPGQMPDPEVLVATVGDVEIKQGHVMAMIQAMPESTRRQSTDMLISSALEQLIMREMLLAAAEDAGLADDEEVQATIDGDARMREEDAMVRVYLDRELDSAVTDDAVQATYDQITANADSELPPLEEVRPQIEEQLRQQAYARLQSDLQQSNQIVFYGPDGEPTNTSNAEQSSEPSGSDSNR